MKRLLLATIVIIYSCNDNGDETTTPIIQNITESVYASGIVKSKDQYEVYSTVNGIIAQKLVSEGETIHKGDAIVTLLNETSQLNAENARLAATYSSIPSNADRLNELKANIELARAKLQTDSALFQRQQNLWKEEIGTRNEMEQRELAYKNAVTAYQVSILQYSNLKKQIDFTAQQAFKNLQINNSVNNDYTVKARQDGKVYSILREPGEMVNTQTPIAVIGDANEFLMELQVDEYDIGKLKTAQKVFVTLDSYKGQVFEASLTKIHPIMNDRSRSFRVEATFISRPPRLYPNLTVEANILISKKINALTIPRTYLSDDNTVMLKNGEKRKVVTGLKDYQLVEIVSGLSKDDMIKKATE